MVDPPLNGERAAEFMDTAHDVIEVDETPFSSPQSLRKIALGFSEMVEVSHRDMSTSTLGTQVIQQVYARWGVFFLGR
ncbi:hypothetical protein [Mesorhizobium sp. M0674]|uniref:hypothetical protein n=1 Tax=unclassified Mesorhizobium TaxID=325217 RepID=UPI003339D56E